MLKNSLVKAFSVLLAFIIIFMAVTSVFASPIGISEIEIESSLKDADRNFYYSLVAGRLKSSFPTTLIDDGFGKREICLFPPEYAGCYIDETNTLHIVLTKNADYMTTISNYQEIMGINDDEIIYVVADFPLSRLYEIQRTLDKVMVEFDMSATGINEFTNRLDISINRTREKDVIDFLKTKFDDFDEKCITFSDPIEIHYVAGSTTDLLPSNTDSTMTPQNQNTLIIGIVILTTIVAATTGIWITKKKQKQAKAF
ncbi:MAG: hypothetical protein LBI79_06145 [Nitrososphaerota archaeon]|jgi:hypothetical protein|nr:hypothetical protein [Nitrososphaerota archaeon]